MNALFNLSRRAIALFIFSLMLNTLIGQQISQTVRGTLIDEVTGMTLIGAEVYVEIEGDWKGTTTDEKGEFLIEGVPIGRRTFVTRYLGYTDKQLANIEITSGKSPFLKIAMKESIEMLKEVEITAKQDKAGTINPSALISTRTFSMDEASRFAGSFNDPGRMAQSFAGAASSDDESNEIIIRGNSPRGVLWRMQGLELPNPNHYREEGGSGGAISIIPDIVLANSDFFTGAFPAEYGNALSGVFDLNLRRGNSQKQETALQLGALGLQAALEGPIVKKNGSSYLFNYRYSTVSLLDKIGISFAEEDEIAPVFQDAVLNLSFPSSKIGRLNIYGLWGKSIAGSNPVRDSTKWQYPGQRYIFEDEYITGVIGANHTFIFKNNRTSLTTAISYNKQADKNNENFIQNDYSDLLTDQEEYNYTTWRAKLTLKHKIKPQLHLESGLFIDQLGFNIKFGELEQGNFEYFLNEKASTQYLRWYGQALIRPSDDLTINAGLHIGYFKLNDQVTPEPRISASYRVSSKSSISYGMGLHSRLEPISLYLARDIQEDGSYIQQNKDLGLTKSWHQVIGWDYRLSSLWRIKAEMYYQYLFNVPIFPTEYGGESALNFSDGFTNQQLLNTGKGRNVGLELTVEKFLDNGYFFLFTSSFFDSKYQDSNGDLFNTRFNIKYTSNLLSGKEWQTGKNKSNTFGINGRIILHGGLRYTPVDEAKSNAGGYLHYDRDKQFEGQLPNFFRVDAGIKYRKNKPKWSWIISLDLQNAFNVQNVYSRDYNVHQQRYIETYQLGLLPVLNFRVEL